MRSETFESGAAQGSLSQRAETGLSTAPVPILCVAFRPCLTVNPLYNHNGAWPFRELEAHLTNPVA